MRSCPVKLGNPAQSGVIVYFNIVPDYTFENLPANIHADYSVPSWPSGSTDRHIRNQSYLGAIGWYLRSTMRQINPLISLKYCNVVMTSCHAYGSARQ